MIMSDNTTSINVMAAPLQGITGSVWRKAHATVFGGVRCYYAPFLRVERGEIRRREARDVEPARNMGIELVPQILGCAPDDALTLVAALQQMGYSHIDVNLGCPHPPLAYHRKGSGLLAHPELIEQLLTALASVQGVTYSVKMRLGWDDATQWHQVMPLMDILHPTLVTVHPRTGRQQYKGDLDLEQMDALVAAATIPVVYNGELHTRQDIDAVLQRYPGIAGVMVGRGLVADPGMLADNPTAQDYQRFHDLVLQGYQQQLNGGDAQLVRHMQELWEYLLPTIDHRLHKAIRKARTLEAYQTASRAALSTLA